MRVHAYFLSCENGDYIRLYFDDEKSSLTIRVEDIYEAEMLMIDLEAAINEWKQARSGADPHDQMDLEDDFDEPSDHCTDEDADRAEDRWRGDRF